MKLIIIITSIIFFILFIFISFQHLSNSYDNFINILFKETGINSDKVSQINITSKLNYLLTTYAFKDKEKLALQDKNKVIYLYNTHNLETYCDSKSVMDTNNVFSNNLKKLGINTLIETKKTSDYLSTGLSYYNISRSFITDVLNDNILYYIDIHRDSVSDIITINNKTYAKILFVLGLDNPNYEENKKVMQEMNNYLEENYKGISKGILEKQGQGVDGVYNQDLSSNVILIEVGGEDNNFNDVSNTTEVLAIMLYHLINDKQV